MPRTRRLSQGDGSRRSGKIEFCSYCSIRENCTRHGKRRLVGFAGELRRSELASIRVERLEKTKAGLCLTIPQTKRSQADSVGVPLPGGQTELCPVRALTAWLAAAGITDGAVFRRIWHPGRVARAEPAASGQPGVELPVDARHWGQASEDAPPPLPQIGKAALTACSIADIVQARAVAAGFGRCDLAGHSLKRGALTTGMDRGIHPAKL